MLLDPHKLDDSHLYALATVPGDNNMYEGVQFSDGVARLVPGYFAKKLVGRVNPLNVFQSDDEIEWVNSRPMVKSLIIKPPKAKARPRIEVIENAVKAPKRKPGRPKKVN